MPLYHQALVERKLQSRLSTILFTFQDRFTALNNLNSHLLGCAVFARGSILVISDGRVTDFKR